MMMLDMDDDVKAVAEFMLAKVPAARLVAVARGVGDLAPLLWGHYQTESIATLRLNADRLAHTQSAANG